MSREVRNRAAALLEVLGVYLTGAALEDKIVQLFVQWHLVAPENPLSFLTIQATNATLVAASRQMLVVLLLQYGSSFVLIIPICWWYRRSGPARYGLTRAGRTFKSLLVAGVVTAALTQWPVLLHTLVDAVHPLGAMAPWRQAFFGMSWMRWQFWLFAAIGSYALVPVLEELLFRGYYQRRLAEDWGDGPAVVGTACFFTFSHKQYLIPNAYNVTQIVSLFCLAIGLGVVFAWTRSLIPSIIAHAIINIPLTPLWQGVLLVGFAILVFFGWRAGIRAGKKVIAHAGVASFVILALGEALFITEVNRMKVVNTVSVGMLLLALIFEWIDRRDHSTVTVPSMQA